MKFGDISIDSNNKIISLSDIKLLKNIDIRVKETSLRYNEERMVYFFKTFTIIGKIGGFKMHKSSNMFLLLLLRHHTELNLSSKYHINKGIYPIEYLVTSYHRGVKNNTYYITNNFQGYDYYVWLPYKCYLECIKAIRWNHISNQSNLPLLIYI